MNGITTFHTTYLFAKNTTKIVIKCAQVVTLNRFSYNVLRASNFKQHKSKSAELNPSNTGLNSHFYL